jgi:hypothetical protein
MGRGANSDEGVPLSRGSYEALSDYLYSEEVFSILEEELPGSSWVQGGCWPLAEALRREIGGELVGVWGRWRGFPDHIVCRIAPNTYLDGDGISTEEELLYRWREIEGMKDPYLEAFQESVFDSVPDDIAILFSERLVERLQPLLRSLAI